MSLVIPQAGGGKGFAPASYADFPPCLCRALRRSFIAAVAQVA